jgi:hypothetical protein
MALLHLAAFRAAGAEIAPHDRSGEYTSTIGTISLMEGTNELVFSYSAAAGDPGNEHQCDWTATARRQDARHFLLQDELTTLRITWEAARVSFRTEAGGECGAGLGDDDFPVRTLKPPRTCTVAVDRAHFYVATASPEQPSAAYVVKGDRVDVLPSQSGDSYKTFFIARFRSPSKTTIGMLRIADLACPSAPK